MKFIYTKLQHIGNNNKDSKYDNPEVKLTLYFKYKNMKVI